MQEDHRLASWALYNFKWLSVFLLRQDEEEEGISLLFVLGGQFE